MAKISGFRGADLDTIIMAGKMMLFQWKFHLASSIIFNFDQEMFPFAVCHLDI